MIDMGVIHGRFQVLHNDHMKYLLAGKARCRHLVVGITNPDPTRTRYDETDPQRSTLQSNPLSYFERYTTIQEALGEAGVNPKDFSIVPFPINFPELYPYYLPLHATFFLTIYDDWGRRKLKRLSEFGVKTEVLWERSLSEKGIRSSEVRLLMVEGKPWEALVPPSTQRLMVWWDIPKRLREIHGKSE